MSDFLNKKDTYFEIHYDEHALTAKLCSAYPVMMIMTCSATWPEASRGTGRQARPAPPGDGGAGRGIQY